MPMYYHPIMTHMPVPHPMGYMPFVPQMMHRQVGPPASPRREVSPSEQDPPPYGTPDNAHPDIPMQDQVQPTDVELNVEPSHPTNPLANTEMVASLSYPLPPSAMVQPNFPDPPPPTATIPVAAGGANGDIAGVSSLPQQQQDFVSLPIHHPQQQQQQEQVSGAMQPPTMAVATGGADATPDRNPVPAMAGDPASSVLINAEPPQLSATPQQSTSPAHSKQPQHAVVTTTPPHPALHAKQAQVSVNAPHNPSSSSSAQSKAQKPSKAATPHTAANPSVSEGPTAAAEGATNPGLPCRSLPASSGGGGGAAGGSSQQPSKQHSGSSKHTHYSKTKPKGDSENVQQRRNTARSKPGPFRTKREEQADERSPGGGDGGGDGKKERRVNHRHSSGGRKRPPNPGNHTGSSTVSGASNNKSNQDPSRTFPRSRSNCSSTSDVGRDTKDFRWGVPSPSDTLDTEQSFPQRTPSLPMNAAAESEPGFTEWPDFPELNVVPSSVVVSRGAFSSSLEFTTSLVEERRGQPWGGEGGSVEDDMFLADPAPPPRRSGDLRGYPLSLSPSQRSPPISLAQCTGDLAHHNPHKH